MKWNLIMYGAGEGCDYTLGCNLKVIQFEVAGTEEAEAHARKVVLRHWDIRIAHAYLCPADWEKKLPVDDWYQEAEAKSWEEKLKEREIKERAEYERLKEKYGD